MSNKRIKYTENNDQRPIKHSVSTNLSHKVNKKKSRPTSKRYKSLLTCVVCDGDAHGYNFDAISCESCKAFFRRNALQPPNKLKCRSNGQCDVSFNVRKRCKKCRLERCFKTGMRKEWILTEKEKAEKRAKIEENHRLKQIQDNNQQFQCLTKQDPETDDELSLDLPSIFKQSILTEFDWFNIELIRNSYTESVKLNQITGISLYPSTQSIKSTLDLFCMPLYVSSMRLISFIKQINEFKQLNKTDQIHLVKLNLLTICFFHSIFIYDPRTDSYHEQDTTDPLFSRKDWIKTLNEQFHFEMKQLRNDLINIFQSDDIIIKLFFLILLFSNQMSLNESCQCSLEDINSLDIFKAQNVFTDLVYKYCLHQYNSHETIVLFSQYIHKLTKMQLLVDEIKHKINDYIDLTQVSPLMQSLLI